MVRSPWACEGTPLKAAPTVVCARTSLAVGSASYDARRQHVHVRYDITPRRMASSWLATQAERGSCAACTAHSRHLLGGTRMKPGDACVVLQVPAA